MSNTARPLLIVLEESAVGVAAARLGTALAARLQCDVVFHLPMPFEPIAAKSASSMEREVTEHETACHERVAPWFDAATAAAQAMAVDSRTLLSIDEDTLAAVLRVAEATDCEMVVLAAHGLGMVERVLHGSLAADLIRECPVPVLVCREGMRAGTLGAPVFDAPEAMAAGPDAASAASPDQPASAR